MSLAGTREVGRSHARKLIEAELLRLAPGDPLPPVRHLMKTHRVSLGKLQSILGHMEKDGLIERRPRRGNFKAGGANTAKLTPFIELITLHGAQRQGGYHSLVVEALSERASKDGHGLRLHRMSSEQTAEDASALAARADVRACVLFAMQSPLVNAVFARPPFASVCMLPKYDPQTYECPCITTSPEVTRLQIEHLHELGHRRIAFLDRYRDADPVWSFLLRREAYYRFMAERGLRVDPRWVVQANTEDENIATAIGQLVDCDPAPTAIIVSDVQLAGVYQSLARRGMEVGRDVSVIGTDDMPEAQMMRPAATTVRNCSHEAAALVLKTLHRLWSNEPVEHVQAIKPKLLIRASTAPHGNATH